MLHDAEPRFRFRAITRRELLSFLGGLVTVPAGAQEVVKANPLVVKPGTAPPGVTPAGIGGGLSVIPKALVVVRAEDLLALEIELVNLAFSGSGASRVLQRSSPGAAFVVLHFAPQHFLEATLSETGAGLPPAPTKPSEALLSERSRVVFAIPAGVASLPGNLEKLLETLRGLPLSLSTAEIPGPLVPTETAIEAVYNLTLSPLSTETRLRFDVSPKTLSGRTALWSAAFNVEGEGRFWRVIRAFGSKDEPFNVPLTGKDRVDLGKLTGTLSDAAAGRKIDAEQLTLSSLGAWTKLHYAALPVPGVSLEAWDQHANMGRDQLVRVLRSGYLLPFGHRASWVQITERKFLPTGGDSAVATLVQHQFLIVRERERLFPVPDSAPARAMPFRRVRLDVRGTPLLDPDWKKEGWPMVGGQDFRFPVTAWDDEGREIHFDLPMIFATEDAGTGAPSVNAGIQKYNVAQGGRQAVFLFGQKMAFAPPTPERPGDTSYEASSLAWSVVSGAESPGFLPKLSSSTVSLPGAQELYGKAIGLTLRYDDLYLNNGFGGQVNVGEVLFRSAKPESLKLPGGSGGGLASPNFTLTHLSRLLGPAAGKSATDASALGSGTFDPKDYFGASLDARFLGAMTLAQLLEGVTGTLADAPKMMRTELPDRIETTRRWETQNLPKKLVFEPRAGAKLALVATATATRSGASVNAPTLRFSATLTNFDLALFQIVRLPFTKLAFVSEAGKKPDVIADFQQIEFGGPLAFINALRKYIPAGGFSDPPSLDVSPSGITAGYALQLPTVPLGSMTLEHIDLGAALTIPFTGQPVRFRFHFNERERPFHIIVALLGGGGFCALDVGADGIERIEASLEFGGAFAINLGVAAGAVSAMAGIYLVYTVAKKSVELTGFVRIRGSLSVLGLITVSMEFYMGLAYDSSNGSVWGEASVKVEIELFFFTKHVTVKTRRKFAGGVGVALGELPERHYASIDDFSDEYGGGDADDEEFALQQPPTKRPVVVSRPQPRATGALRAKDLLGSSELNQYCAAFA